MVRPVVLLLLYLTIPATWSKGSSGGGRASSSAGRSSSSGSVGSSSGSSISVARPSYYKSSGFTNVGPRGSVYTGNNMLHAEQVLWQSVWP
jgi:hypothetical protein